MIALRWRITRPAGVDPVRASDITNQEITRGLQTLKVEMERRVRVRTPKGVFGEGGGLAGSIAGEVLGVPARMTRVTHSSVYGDVVELGRRPGPVSWAGLQSITLWVEKILRPPAQDLAYVAFLVAQKIAHRGFPGAHMFERAFNESRGMLETLWARVGEQIAARMRGGYGE